MLIKNSLPEGFMKVWKMNIGYSLEFGEPTDLIYNIDHGIIYYYFNNHNNRSMCPYYGKHGKLCTIRDMQIVEID